MTQQYHNILIIGSAGRLGDAFTRASFQAACAHARTFCTKIATEVDHPIRLISGGAPGGDHIAVKLFLEQSIATEALTLHLPAMYNRNTLRFVSSMNSVASTINELHHKFSLQVGEDSGLELDLAIRRGAEIFTHQGFHRRNDAIAAHNGHLLAYTFHGPDAVYQPGERGYASASVAGLRRGGSAYTWEAAEYVSSKEHFNVATAAL